MLLWLVCSQWCGQEGLEGGYRRSHDILQTLCRAEPALWPPKASQRAQQRWVPLLHWPLRADEVGVGFVSEIACEAVTADEAVSEVEAVLEDEAVSEPGSAESAVFVFDAGAVTRPAFWAFELLEAAALMVLGRLGVVRSPLI